MNGVDEVCIWSLVFDSCCEHFRKIRICASFILFVRYASAVPTGGMNGRECEAV